MKKMVLNGIEINYNITKKNNKNTYFYFKRDGYIQINLSRYQREKDVLEHMKLHADSFVKKYLAQISKQQHQSSYSLWGIPFEMDENYQDDVIIDEENKIIKFDKNSVDHLNIMKRFERQEMMKFITELSVKYATNPIVDISGVSYRTHFTTSRHGSCHPKRRRIHINTHLIQYDKKYTEYVFCHEIAHLLEANHSSRFYDVLEQLYPNYKETRNALKRMW